MLQLVFHFGLSCSFAVCICRLFFAVLESEMREPDRHSPVKLQISLSLSLQMTRQQETGAGFLLEWSAGPTVGSHSIKPGLIVG